MLFRHQTIRILGTTGSQVPSCQSTSNVRHSASSPKDPTLQGCPGLSLLTAWRSSVSFSQQRTDVAAAWKCRQSSPGRP
ncbi:helicase ARIP4-like [Symphalangus syndactylus]|uniref:helicase ARIP4-like n=1 Tax=Symphalangus syndactylus TaxID=9590 RepID=UPI0024429E1B|nr:helicase ARIP4-like isoform X2 [Symphalangus syndactylus]